MKTFFAFVALLIAASSVALSQEPASADSVRLKLPPVTVTATRVSEAWVKVPMAVTTLTQTDLQHAKGFGTSDVLGGIPGVSAQSRAGATDERISIRGFGARGADAKSNAGTTRGIRWMVDGFPETEPDGRTSLDLFDFANAGQIDVIRSNSSVVWGNAGGGVINVISNTGFSSPYVRTGVVNGSYGLMSERLSTGTMLGDGKFFLSLTNTKTDGYRYHSDAKQTLLNTGVVTSLGARTNLGIYVSATSNFYRIAGPLTQVQFDSLREQADSVFIKRNERRYNRVGRIGVTVGHEFNDLAGFSTSLFAAPKFIQRSERNTFRDFTRYHVGGNFVYHNRFTLFPGTNDLFIMGVDEAYQDGAIVFYGLLNGERKDNSISQDKREGAENTGVFLSEKVELNEHWTLNVGGRYDNIRYFYDNYLDASVNDKISFEHFTPKVGITYSFNPMHSVYANLGGGVEAPAGNEVDPEDVLGTDAKRMLNPLLAPITSTTLEIGTKHIVALADAGSITYDIAAYMINVKNDLIPYGNGNFYLSAAETRRTGLELGGKLELRNGLSLAAMLTTSNNVYVSYIVDPVFAGAAGDFKDKKQAGVPPTFYQFDAKIAPAMLCGGFAQLRFHGMSDYFVNDANTLSVPAYMTIDAVLGVDGLHLGSSGLSLSAFAGVYNLSDKVYAASAWINPRPAANPSYLETGLPRNFVGSITLAWGL